MLILSRRLEPEAHVGLLPELGEIPGEASPEGSPALHCTPTSPNTPALLTVASQLPNSTLETRKARSSNPTCATDVGSNMSFTIKVAQ